MYEAFCSGNVLQVVTQIHIFDSKLYRQLWLPVLFFFPPCECVGWGWGWGHVTCLSVCDMSTSALPPFILA